MNISKIRVSCGGFLQRRRNLIATPVAVSLFFLFLSTSAVADMLNASVSIGNNGNGSGSVTPGLPSFVILDAAGPAVCGFCSPGSHPTGTSFLLNLVDTSIRDTYQGHLNFHGPTPWEQPAGDPANPLLVSFPVTFEGSFAPLSGPSILLSGNGTGTILLDSLAAFALGDARLYLGSTYTVSAATMPEPGTAVLLATGGVLFLWFKRWSVASTHAAEGF